MDADTCLQKAEYYLEIAEARIDRGNWDSKDNQAIAMAQVAIGYAALGAALDAARSMPTTKELKAIEAAIRGCR